MGRTHGHGDGEDTLTRRWGAGSCATAWDAATPEMLNTGLGLHQGGRRGGCFAAASLVLHVRASPGPGGSAGRGKGLSPESRGASPQPRLPPQPFAEGGEALVLCAMRPQRGGTGGFGVSRGSLQPPSLEQYGSFKQCDLIQGGKWGVQLPAQSTSEGRGTK